MKTINKLLFAIALLLVLFMLKPSTSYAADVVNPKQTYTYDMMVRDIKELSKRYPDIINHKIIGNSEYNRPIYAVSLGTGNANVFINGSHHAREWITTNLNMYMLEQYAKMYKGKQSFGGYNVKKVLDETTIWFVPMVNPDGVTLQQYGPSKFPSTIRSSLIRMNDGSSDFRKWKANAKGVDLNRQYKADWANIKNNYSLPRWSHHKGYAPEQAAETKTLVKFTEQINPEMAVSYHSSGEILYWNFKQSGSIYTRDHNYAKRIGQLTGYRLIYPGLNPSGGGYTDWFISKYKRPAFTPELGRYPGETHVPLSEFDRIWYQNKYIGLYVASEGHKLYIDRGGKPKYQKVNVKINDKLVTFEQSALLVDGKTVVPVRGVFEQLGATVAWNAKSSEIIARRGTTIVEMKVGSKTMKVNGTNITLEVAPQIINGHTMIPLRAVSEAFGAEVGWDSASTTALITLPTYDDAVPPEAPTVKNVTDVSLQVTGNSERNATVVVKKDGKILGQALINADGKFSIPIPAQPSNTILSVTAIDLAGNTSSETLKTVQFTNTFTDTIGHWTQEPLGYLKENGITNGYPDGSFGITRHISRAEAAVFLVRALELNIEDLANPNFPDVPASYKYFKHISAIHLEGIMQGYPTGAFKPEHTLTRAEMATILVNTFDLVIDSENLKGFTDISGHWSEQAILILASNGLSDGYPDGSFKPNNPIQRGEFGTLLSRVLQLQAAKVQEVRDSMSNEAEEATEIEETVKEEEKVTEHEDDIKEEKEITEQVDSMETDDQNTAVDLSQEENSPPSDIEDDTEVVEDIDS